jgi:hypothetical protein
VLVSYVIRLVPSSLAAGELVGQAEAVDTGRQSTFRNVEELVRILCASDFGISSRELS